jgi:hypothetical protein
VIVTGTVVVQPLASLTVIVVPPAARPLNVPLAWNVTPSFEYVYGDVPPEPLTVTLPVELPKQRTFVCNPTLAVSAAVGCVIVTNLVAVQPFASVTVTLYVPATRPVRSCVVAPFDQAYAYGAVPPVTVRSIDPVAPPKQATFT